MEAAGRGGSIQSPQLWSFRSTRLGLVFSAEENSHLLVNLSSDIKNHQKLTKLFNMKDSAEKLLTKYQRTDSWCKNFSTSTFSRSKSLIKFLNNFLHFILKSTDLKQLYQIFSLRVPEAIRIGKLLAIFLFS